MPMPKLRRIDCGIHLHFKKSFASGKEMNKLAADFGKYLKKETRKAKGIKFRRGTGDRSISTSTKQNYVNFLWRKQSMSITIRGRAKPTELRALDELVNKAYGFLVASELAIKYVGVGFSTEFQLDRNPVERFYDKAAVADFSSRSRLVFTPVGTVFKTKAGTSRIFVVLSFEPEGERAQLDISRSDRNVQVPPWDLLRKNAKFIDDIKDQLIQALGVREK